MGDSVNLSADFLCQQIGQPTKNKQTNKTPPIYMLPKRDLLPIERHAHIKSEGIKNIYNM